MTSAIEAYKAFDQRSPGWIKVKLEPDGAGMANGREAAATDQRPTP